MKRQYGAAAAAIYAMKVLECSGKKERRGNLKDTQDKIKSRDTSLEAKEVLY